MTTTEIKGFFSKEHSLMVFLICLSLYGNWINYNENKQIRSELKLITYRLNHDGKTDTEKSKLASFNFYGRKGKPQLQKTNPMLACRFGDRERIAKGKHRIY